MQNFPFKRFDIAKQVVDVVHRFAEFRLIFVAPFIIALLVLN